MGQQQLLLVILVTILVGIATVVGINVFGTSAENANRDAVRQDIAQIASSAQGWYMKPTQLGGGGDSFEGVSFNDITFPADEVTNSGLTATNLNGTYVITDNGVGATEFTVTATPASSEAVEGENETDPVTKLGFTATISKGGLEIDEVDLEQ